MIRVSAMVVVVIAILLKTPVGRADVVTPETVLKGVEEFLRKTARDDGSFQPGIDAMYEGRSDCAFSDLAATTYAVVIARTFGWKLPHEERTIAFLKSRQSEDGLFFHLKGKSDPKSAHARLYNITQGVVALHALGQKPKFDPLPEVEKILRDEADQLPPWASSFFPLIYLCLGKPIPDAVDARIREVFPQAEDGWVKDLISPTYHVVHYYRLLNRPVPKADVMLARFLREQKSDGSWVLLQPPRDAHNTFDAVFVVHQLGGNREECRASIAKAVAWTLTCRNADGGFGHFPGYTSDWDAIYFQVGTLVMGGYLKPAEPLPKDRHLLSWGHLVPRPARKVD